MHLTKTDREILDSYCKTAEGLADYLGEGFEIIVHSLERLDHSVISIFNGYHSNRSIGAPVTNLALEMLKKIENHEEPSNGTYATYFSTSATGVTLRSSTIPIYGTDGNVIGLLCMNFYMDTPISSLSRLCIPSQHQVSKEQYLGTIEDVIENTVKEIKNKVLFNPSISSTNKNKEIIRCLLGKGIFNIKNAVDKVAEMLGISKNTVYLHLRSLQKDDGKEDVNRKDQ